VRPCLITWSYLNSMSSVVGSVGYTSMAAAATLPLSMARARASSSMIPPRRHADHPHAVLHLGEGLVVDKAERLLVLRQVDAE